MKDNNGFILFCLLVILPSFTKSSRAFFVDSSLYFVFKQNNAVSETKFQSIFRRFYCLYFVFKQHKVVSETDFSTFVFVSSGETMKLKRVLTISGFNCSLCHSFMGIRA